MFSQGRKTPSVIATARGERVYAVGDVHGRLDLLDRLIERIDADLADDAPLGTSRIIFLGDIIDRGPDSLACLQRIHELRQRRHVDLVLGNHEDLLLRSIAGDPKAQAIWLQHGGRQTLDSLGVKAPEDGEDPIDFGERVGAALPEPIHALLDKAPTHARSGDYLFVHAGVRPGVPFDRQDPFDLYFIRDEFTGSKAWHGAMVVHGHTIVDSVQTHANRIAVDTGAFRTGRLSCIRLDGTRRKTLATDDGSAPPDDANAPAVRAARSPRRRRRGRV